MALFYSLISSLRFRIKAGLIYWIHWIHLVHSPSFFAGPLAPNFFSGKVFSSSLVFNLVESEKQNLKPLPLASLADQI